MRGSHAPQAPHTRISICKHRAVDVPCLLPGQRQTPVPKGCTARPGRLPVQEGLEEQGHGEVTVLGVRRQPGEGPGTSIHPPCCSITRLLRGSTCLSATTQAGLGIPFRR